MTESDSFRPKWASAPHTTITETLSNLGLSEKQFAEKLGRSEEYVSDLLNGNEPITLELAEQLEETLGATVEFWMSRDYQYRQDLQRLESKYRNWLERLPVEDMVDFGWIQDSARTSELFGACLNFFDVPSIESWQEAYGNLPAVASYKTSPSYDSRKESVAVWLRQGERKANEIECDSWDREGFKESLSEIRSLTKEKDPNQFIPKLREACAENGVAVVVLPSPTGCHASGATYFPSSEKALLLLSFRHLSNDHFWFTFFHEAGHLVLHSGEDLFIDDDDTLSGEYELGMTQEEREANKFSEDILIPPARREEMLNIKISHRNVVRFAVEIGIAPGIVVGQLQHNGIIGFDTLNNLKRYYGWGDIPNW
jgi:plasmid maintenance system antidote protein VapI/Zn-dependent peptidase ImmA (M78 family)